MERSLGADHRQIRDLTEDIPKIVLALKQAIFLCWTSILSSIECVLKIEWSVLLPLVVKILSF